MKEVLITQLRDKNSDRNVYRETIDQLAFLMAQEITKHLRTEEIPVETPCGPANGSKWVDDVVLVPILRSGVAMLHTFLKVFPNARVGFIGLQRNEETSVASQYYLNLPAITGKEHIVILDPMIATGGSALATLNKLCELGAKPEKISLCSFISAMEGEERVRREYPDVRILVAQQDLELNAQNFIVPGLGDFGDRYFGTAQEER